MEKLRHPHGSIPGNPLLAEPLYLTKYIERMGTGTGDMIEPCRAAGLPKPEFALTDGFVTTIRRKTNGAFLAVGGQVTAQVTAQVTEEVRRTLLVLHGEHSRRQIQEALLLKSRANFEERYLKPALEAGVIEPTSPAKPTSRFQKYRLSEKGRAWLAAQQEP